ncbi:hypothetical protein MAP00_008103 [Monascus purpureus]|nr:hypothetical protein MAP00_008103 [Monascus purpureus]
MALQRHQGPQPGNPAGLGRHRQTSLCRDTGGRLLNPWPDSSQGLEQLNRKFRTYTLSNGNVSLLEGLALYPSFPFTDIASAEQFGAYRPSSKAYLGAAERFGVDPREYTLEASHLYDLKAAKALGFQTVFVGRPVEEPLVPVHTAEVEQEQYVDMEVGRGIDGLLEIARRFGIRVQ